MTVFLVEVTTVTQLVDRLRKGKYRSSQDVLAHSGFLSLPLITELTSCNSVQAIE